MQTGVVLAIHGVGNRDKKRFAKGEVQPLATGIGRAVGHDIIPVFWGDLAPQLEVLKSIPDADEGQVLGDSLEVAAAGVAASSPEVVDALSERVRSEVRRSARTEMPTSTEAVVREAISEAGVTNEALATLPELAEALAQLVLATEPSGAAEIHLGNPIDAFKDAARSVVIAVDRALGREVGGVLQRALRGREAGLAGMFARTAGDILTYGRGGSVSARMRGRLDAAYQDAKNVDAPVHVLAHSLGALIAVEWLLGAESVLDDDRDPTPPGKRIIGTFVTFGAQVAMFAELHGLTGASSNFLPPAPLPVRVDRWVNVWHQLDPLAFVFGRVLSYGPGKGTPVDDLRLELNSLPNSRSEFGFHSSYWKDPRLHRRVRMLLASDTSDNEGKPGWR